MYRDFSNEPDPAAAMRAHYAELRRRTFAVPARPKAEVEPETAPVRTALPAPVARDIIDVASDATELRGRPVKQIIAHVARESGIKVDEILGPSRRIHVVAARHKAIVQVARERPDMSLPAIGRRFRRDHTTILHALRLAGLRTDAPPRSRKPVKHPEIDARKARACQMRQTGHTTREIADALGVTSSRVCDYVRRVEVLPEYRERFSGARRTEAEEAQRRSNETRRKRILEWCPAEYVEAFLKLRAKWKKHAGGSLRARREIEARIAAEREASS
jgi:transposase